MKTQAGKGVVSRASGPLRVVRCERERVCGRGRVATPRDHSMVGMTLQGKEEEEQEIEERLEMEMMIASKREVGGGGEEEDNRWSVRQVG